MCPCPFIHATYAMASRAEYAVIICLLLDFRFIKVAHVSFCRSFQHISGCLLDFSVCLLLSVCLHRNFSYSSIEHDDFFLLCQLNSALVLLPNHFFLPRCFFSRFIFGTHVQHIQFVCEQGFFVH